RSKVASRPSSSSDFPIAPVTASLGNRQRAAILIRPGEAIPFGRPYLTHGGVYHLILQTTNHLLLVHLRIHHQFILRVWMHQIRLILDLRLEIYHLDWVTLRGEYHDVIPG
ncbi:hypothetical protein Tco_0402518, partial [Tanacetum coccineum]